jgi:hypothetical protein
VHTNIYTYIYTYMNMIVIKGLSGGIRRREKRERQ